MTDIQEQPVSRKHELEKVKPFIQLLLRSPNRVDGWRSISDTLSAFAAQQCTLAPELFELDHDDHGFRIRLTERGEIIANYL